MRIAFVCSGNICRSPMAEGLATTIDDGSNVFVSAGTHPDTGWFPTEPAQRVAAEVGADISSYRAVGIDALDDPEPDLVYVMEPHHLEAVIALRPDWADRTRLIDPSGAAVTDPYQRPEATYRRVRNQILIALRQRSKEWTTES